MPQQSTTPPSEGAKKPRKKREKDVWNFSIPYETDDGLSAFSGEEQVDSVLWDLATHHFGGKKGVNDKFWIKKNKYQSKKPPHSFTQYYACRFENEAKCPFQLCTVTTDGITQIFESKFDHSDHANTRADAKTTTNYFMINAFSSPSKLANGSESCSETVSYHATMPWIS